MASAVVMSRPKPTQIDTITIDAATEQHQLSSTITDHPVEDGADISDHSRPDPETVTLECVISNTPLTSGSSRTVTSGSQSFTTTAAARDPQRAQAAYTALQKLRTGGKLVTVVTSLRSYESMAIQSISIPRDAKTADALKFAITLKQVRIVKNKLTRTVTARDTRAQPAKATGNQVPKSTSPAQESSALFDAAEGLADSSNPTLSGLGRAALRR